MITKFNRRSTTELDIRNALERIKYNREYKELESRQVITDDDTHKT